MLFIEKVRSNREEFRNKVIDISAKLKVNPDWLMLVMNSESKLNHRAFNPDSGATGLIQFIPKTAIGLGTTTQELRGMSNVKQLDYVYLYFKRFAGKMNSYYDMYLATFFPLAIGKPDDWVFQTAKLSAFKIAKQNPAINKFPKDRKITISEFKKYVESTIPKKAQESISDGNKISLILPAIIALAVVSFFIVK